MPWRPWEDVLALVELAAPSACAGCGRAGRRWCPACDRELTSTQPHRWSPTPCPPGLPPTWSGPAYEGALREAVVAWKDGGRTDLTAVLAPVLRGVLAAALDGSPHHRTALAEGGPVVIIPAPSSRRATRQRGEHRVRALTLAALAGDDRRGHGRAHGPGGSRARTRLPVLDGLELARPVADQAGLGAQDRARNLSGALRAHGRTLVRAQGLPCVVVDDVVTTGATLSECARVLRAAGSGPVVAVTLAATRRRGTGPTDLADLADRAATAAGGAARPSDRTVRTPSDRPGRTPPDGPGRARQDSPRRPLSNSRDAD